MAVVTGERRTTTFAVDEPDDIAPVRRAISELLTAVGLTRARVEDVTVAASELMANALVGGGPAAEVALSIGDRSILVSVEDQRTGWPKIPPADPARIGGNGLRIVEALTDEWGASPTDGPGKKVWFRIAR